MTDLVAVRRYASLEEARDAWAFIRSGGIAGELLGHEAGSNLVWGGTYGIDLLIPAAEAEDASAALNEVERGDFALSDVAPIERSWVTRAKAAYLLLCQLDAPLLIACAIIALLSLSRRSAASA